MHHSDPMGYSMEQLVRALAAETMSEISYDEAVVEEESFSGMWEHIASALLEEIDATYEGQQFEPYGYYADECLIGLKPLVQPYAVYPAAPKLLSAFESLVQNKMEDPRAYTTLVVRAMGSDAADNWQKEGRQFR